MNIEKIELLPQTPGVYKFLDKNKKILYIGKAINLRSRVSSYFSSQNKDRPRIKRMIPSIKFVEVVETNNEVESLVLESVLIKKHQPFFNSDLKDDKSHAWIYITTDEKFPTVKVVRNTDIESLKNGRAFGPYPSTSSTKRIFTYLRKIYPFCTCTEKSSRECMYFHIGLCPGPYQGHISRRKYMENIKGIIAFLEGKNRGHIKNLRGKMKEYSRNRDYEKAAEMRDKIEDLEYLSQKIDFEYKDTEITYRERRKKLLKDTFRKLGMEIGVKKLRRIECYDISNLQGKEAYGSMVVAEDGEIKRSEYRIFKIRDIDTPNDPAMLKEVLRRRFESKKKGAYKRGPNVVLIDGGKSQLSVVQPFIPKDTLLMGISKGKRLKRRGARQLDEFYIWKDSKPVSVNIENSSILIELRDEAHRFAILHHRKARLKHSSRSQLLSIPGVGEKRAKALLRKFRTVQNIKEASLKELEDTLRNEKLAKEVKDFLLNNRK